MDTLQVKCQSCDQQLSSFFCHDCRIAVPVPRGVDYFRYLGLPQRPLVDAKQLEETYLRLSQEYHPDRHPDLSGEDKEAILYRSALLNQAYSCLRDPKQRVQYLVELLTGGERSRSKAIPSQIAALFRQVQTKLMAADAYLKEAERPKSSIEAVTFALKPNGAMTQREGLLECQRLTEAQQAAVLDELQDIDAQWDQAGEASEQAFNRLANVADALSYLDRLGQQVHERLVSLHMLSPGIRQTAAKTPLPTGTDLQ
ncbi:MAG: DnaJ domain-containing protein [Nitrospirota bacterium]|jgi:Fe-S protein assembly co-chaperone HscB